MSTVRLSAALEQLFERRESLTQGSRDTYVRQLALFERITGIRDSRALANATPKQIDDALKAALGTHKPSTVRAALTLARTLAKRLSALGQLPRNPLVDLDRLPKSKPPDWNVLQPGELEKVLAWCEAGKRFEEHALFSLLGRHGLRVSEMCALRWEEHVFEDDGNLIVVFRGKGNKEARMKLRADVAESLKRARKKHGFTVDGPVVPNRFGQPYSRFLALMTVERDTLVVLGRRVTPHGLRATMVSSMISKHGLEAARQLARHENVETTLRYSRWRTLDVDAPPK